jgi:hypothetical protein
LGVSSIACIWQTQPPIQSIATFSSEFTDADLDALADADEYCLEDAGFYEMPTQREIEEMRQVGEALLFIDWFRTI